jgi:hypothetical protein
MTSALIILGLLLIYYGAKAVKENPDNPNWSRAIVTALFWPLSLFFKRDHVK